MDGLWFFLEADLRPRETGGPNDEFMRVASSIETCPRRQSYAQRYRIMCRKRLWFYNYCKKDHELMN